MKRIEIPQNIIDSLRSQLIESAKEQEEERAYMTTLTDECELDNGQTLVVDADVEYWPKFERCVCSTDRGDEEWLSVKGIDTNLIDVKAAIYDSDNELIDSIFVNADSFSKSLQL